MRWATSPSAEGLTRQPHNSRVRQRCAPTDESPRQWDGERGQERRCQKMRVIYTAIRRYVAELNRMQDVGRGLSTHKGEKAGR
ncbi:hypothetical protein GCM10009676_29430 [Prauserella halophila]|uniref:Uncharacterized protein n=1 Tax=Prauserella halophila TaxID=185641 RepID=A0ABN1W9V7_9PSEU